MTKRPAKKKSPEHSKRTHTLIIVASWIVIAIGAAIMVFNLLGSRDTSWFSMWFVPIYLVVMGGYLVWMNKKALNRLAANEKLAR